MNLEENVGCLKLFMIWSFLFWLLLFAWISFLELLLKHLQVTNKYYGRLFLVLRNEKKDKDTDMKG